MERRRILVVAGAVTATVLAGTAAVAANVGLLNSTGDSGVGELSPIVTTDTGPAVADPVETETIFVDEPAPAPASSADSMSTPATAPAASSFDDDEFDDDEFDDDKFDDDKFDDDKFDDDEFDDDDQGHDSDDDHDEDHEGRDDDD